MKTHSNDTAARRRRGLPGTLLGSALVLAWLALLSPGVRAVQAEGPAGAAEAVHEAPSCKVPAPVSHSPRATRALELFRRGTQAGPVPGHPEIVVLNGRGYNYRSARSDEAAQLRFEALRAAAPAH